MPPETRLFAVAAIIVLAGVASGCGGSSAIAPVDSFENERSERTASHTVKRGETLYSIAWLYGLDYRDLAAGNGVREPFTIYPGQRLRLDVDTVVASAIESGAPAESRAIEAEGRGSENWKALKPDPPQTSTGSTASAPPAPPAPSKPAESEPSRRKKPAQKPIAGNIVKGWMWPTEGRVVTDFARSGRKGVNISGQLGQSVVAAADGHVVYAGGGLRGYGELIILKHNKRFLSAYAHNNQILVKEGDKVRVGQRIAEMGSTGADKVMLHFEIRRDGTPVDPVRYLPK